MLEENVMRTYKQVINQILNFASSEEQVRVVMLNGSRVNSNAPVDIMQDYDVVFFINAIEDIKYSEKRSGLINLEI